MLTNAQDRYLFLAIEMFDELYDRIRKNEAFWELPASDRLATVTHIFEVYNELINFEPIKQGIKSNPRPDYELLLWSFSKFLRNLLLHFPFFNQWDDIYIEKDILCAISDGGSMHKFLSNTNHSEKTKFRLWDSSKQQMIYIFINLNTGYNKGHVVFLEEMLNEEDGVTLMCELMKDAVYRYARPLITQGAL